MDWNDPKARLHLIETVGHDEYHRRFEAHLASTVIEKVNGYNLRPVNTRFGRLIMVSGTNNAFAKIEQARDFAISLEMGDD